MNVIAELGSGSACAVGNSALHGLDGRLTGSSRDENNRKTNNRERTKRVESSYKKADK